MRMVDVAMLVRQTIPRVVEHALDVLAQLVSPFDGRVQRRHVCTVVDSLGEQKHRNRRLHRIGSRRDGLQADGIRSLTHSAVRSRQTELASQKRQHHDRPAIQLAIATALRTPPLHNVQRLGRAHLFSKLLNTLRGNARDGSRPFRGLLHFVVAGSHDVILVGFALPLGRLGHSVVIIAHAIGIEEILVHHLVADQFMRNGGT